MGLLVSSLENHFANRASFWQERLWNLSTLEPFKRGVLLSLASWAVRHSRKIIHVPLWSVPQEMSDGRPSAKIVMHIFSSTHPAPSRVWVTMMAQRCFSQGQWLFKQWQKDSLKMCMKRLKKGVCFLVPPKMLPLAKPIFSPNNSSEKKFRNNFFRILFFPPFFWPQFFGKLGLCACVCVIIALSGRPNKLFHLGTHFRSERTCRQDSGRSYEKWSLTWDGKKTGAAREMWPWTSLATPNTLRKERVCTALNLAPKNSYLTSLNSFI